MIILSVYIYFRQERAKAAKLNTEDSLKKRPKSDPSPEMPSQVRLSYTDKLSINM